MKKLFLILILMLISFSVDAQVQEQMSRNNVGQPIIRFFNNFNRPVSCYYRDQYNYFTFVIHPRSYSFWYPVYGYYKWNCNF